MTGYCDIDKARRDAEWLAGSERDDAERNLARAYLQLCAASPAPKVTDEMVEAAAKAQYELEHTDLPWERCGDIFANGYRDDARVVLTAALRAAQGREG